MVIINRGKSVVEGKVDELLRGTNMKISISSDDNPKAFKIIKSNYSNAELSENRIVLSISKNEIPSLNRNLVDNNIDIYSIEPVKSLEEYFINVTKK